MKVAFGLEQDLAVLAALAAEVQPHEKLMVDANQGWDIAQARRAIPAFQPFNLGWIEEPLPADSPVEEWAEVAMLSASPIAGGENVSGFKSFHALINERNHAIVQPDLLKWGGVTGCFAVARQAVKSGLSYCPHWLGSGIGLAAAAHVLAAVGGNGVLEHDVMENPLREVLARPFPRVQDGKYPLPTTPGLGVEPALDEAARWLVDHKVFRRP